MQNIIVIGATSLIGQYLLPRLTAKGFETQPCSRHPSKNLISFSQAQPADALIHLGPLWVLPELLPQIAKLGVTRIIAFGSTSRFTKEHSSDPKERETVKKLADAEAEVAKICESYKIQWTILRPTLIYGDIPHQAGKALDTIIRIIRLGKFFPIIGQAAGLRQPVHADDLALACVVCLSNPNTYQQAYNLSGGETLPYFQMVDRIFQKLGQKPRFIHLPLSMVRMGLKIVRQIPRYHFLTLEMANRMNQDLCFDHTTASHDFSWQPREFLTAE